jgi:hypothetical protein
MPDYRSDFFFKGGGNKALHMIGFAAKKVEESLQGPYPEVEGQQLQPGFFAVGRRHFLCPDKVLMRINSQHLHLMPLVYHALYHPVHGYGASFAMRIGRFITYKKYLHQGLIL